MGSKNARYVSSIINRPTLGGDKKTGLVTTAGHPANLSFRLTNNTGTIGFFPLTQYGSVSKGSVGHRFH
jgi:hypothetical protein